MATAVYANPVGAGLRPERIDQGVDYGGPGALYALGAGTIASVYNSGWPGGTFIALRLEAGPYAGQYVYYAEDIAPAVAVGDHVTAGQLIGHATGGPSGIELGWAAAPGSGNSLASQAGQIAAGLQHGDAGAYSTAYGVAFNDLIKSLGAPSGILVGPVQGTVPPQFGTVAAAAAAQATASPSDLLAAALVGAGIPAVMVLVLFGVVLLAGAVVAAAAVGAAAAARR